MALIFSEVKLTSKNTGFSTSFLVGGVPTSKEDFYGWVAFEQFINELHTLTSLTDCIYVNINTFRYGDQEDNNATPEEIAYFMMRIKDNPDFIKTRTQKVSESYFEFQIL